MLMNCNKGVSSGLVRTLIPVTTSTTSYFLLLVWVSVYSAADSLSVFFSLSSSERKSSMCSRSRRVTIDSLGSRILTALLFRVHDGKIYFTWSLCSVGEEQAGGNKFSGPSICYILSLFLRGLLDNTRIKNFFFVLSISLEVDIENQMDSNRPSRFVRRCRWPQYWVQPSP